MIIQDDDKVDVVHSISLLDITYNHYKVTFGPVITNRAKAKFKAITHLASNLLCISSRMHLNTRYYQIKLPRLAEENATNIYISTINTIEGPWCDQSLCGKKNSLEVVYGLDKHEHVGYSDL